MIKKAAFHFSALSPFKGSNTVYIWSFGALKIRYYSAIMPPSNKAPWGLIRRGVPQDLR